VREMQGLKVSECFDQTSRAASTPEIPPIRFSDGLLIVVASVRGNL